MGMPQDAGGQAQPAGQGAHSDAERSVVRLPSVPAGQGAWEKPPPSATPQK